MNILQDLYENLYFQIILNNGYKSLYTFIYSNKTLYYNYKHIENILGQRVIKYYKNIKNNDYDIYYSIKENNILGRQYINSLRTFDIKKMCSEYKLDNDTIMVLYYIYKTRMRKAVKNPITRQRIRCKFFKCINDKQVLSENIISKYLKYFDTCELIKKQKLSENFLWENRYNLDFDIVLQYQNVSNEFINKIYNETSVIFNLPI